MCLGKKIATTVLFVFLQSVCAQTENQGIKLIKQVANDSVYFHLVNHFYAPVSITITPKENYNNSIRAVGEYILPQRDTLKNCIVVPQEFVKDTAVVNYSDYATFQGNLGNPNLRSDLGYLYNLPFEEGTAHQIMQPNFGKLSHNTKKSYYSIDFTMDIGTPIHAARSGIVVKTQDKYTEHGGIELKNMANTIAIFHEDGTIAHYDHLKPKSVFVEPGELVERGQLIGLSGFTGYTTKPHLHFAIQNGKNESVPVYFKGYKNKVLKKGRFYKNKG